MVPFRRLMRQWNAHQARRPRTPTADEIARRRSISWMVWLSVALFFVPFVNGLVGGAFGGFAMGSARRALRLEVFPALAWGLVISTVAGVLFTQLLGYVTLVPAGWLLLTGAGLLAGAAAGGLLAGGVARRRAHA